MEHERQEILLYNIESVEKTKIKSIFMSLNIDIKITEIEELEDLIAYPAFCAFIKKTEDEEQMHELEEMLSVLRGWQINFLVDENFFNNIDKITEKIQSYYEESENLKVKYDYKDVIKDGIIGFAVGDALRSAS